MRPICTLVFTLAAMPAAAHPGHLAEVAGHNHWLAGAAIAAAAAALAWGLLKGKKSEDAEPGAEAEETETPEAEAA
jgi:hypothetical protein